MNRQTRRNVLVHLQRWWQQCTSVPQRRQPMALVALMLVVVVGVTIRPAVSANALPESHHASLSQPSEPPPQQSQQSQQQYAGGNVSSLLSQGHQLYQIGKLSDALSHWRQAAESDNQPLRQALSWSYVSLAAQDLGDWQQADSAIARSLSLLADHPESEEANHMRAQVLNVQGRLSLKKGQPETAWEIWEQAETTYERSNDWLGKVGAQINQAQALQTMGLYRRASLKLEEVVDDLQDQPDSALKAIALESLGNVFQTAGSLEQSRQYLNESIALSERIGDQAAATATLFSLANTLRLIGDTEAAIQTYERVEAQSLRAPLQLKAQINRFSLLLSDQQWQAAQNLLPNVYNQLKSLPASRESIYSRVNLVESLLSNSETGSNAAHQPMSWLPVDKIATLLSESAQQAESLQDTRAQSLALGELSKVYGHIEQWTDSQVLSQSALQLAQVGNAQDIAYRWQQQLGKAYYAQSNLDAAITSYTEAVETLNQVRRDLLATNSDVQYSFKKTVEPVYRELVHLLLLPDAPTQKSLLQAREAIEALQLAELENYFKSACIDSSAEYIDRLDSEAAVLYPIVLSDRVEVVLSLPDLSLQHYRTWQTEETTNQTIGELFQYLNPALSTRKRLGLSRQVYDWVVAPAEAVLNKNNIKTLVFVLDGRFRSIPMAALYDGEKYLLQKYNIALTPGLKLLGPHFQNPKPLAALMLGITEARDGFFSAAWC